MKNKNYPKTYRYAINLYIKTHLQDKEDESLKSRDWCWLAMLRAENKKSSAVIDR